MNKIFKYKNGSSYWFIYSLAFLFITTILYIIFNQVLNVHLYPVSQEMTNGVMTEPDKWISFWNFTPYILVIIVIIFMFFKLTARESIGE